MPPTMWHRGASLTPVASHDDKVVAANVLNGNRSNATPHSDDVRTISTAIDADGQSEHVSLATRPGHAGHQVETDISLLRSETTVKTRPRLAPTDWSAETAAGATST